MTKKQAMELILEAILTGFSIHAYKAVPIVENNYIVKLGGIPVTYEQGMEMIKKAKGNWNNE